MRPRQTTLTDHGAIAPAAACALGITLLLTSP